MVIRPYWQQQIEEAWLHRSIIWLSGVRRAGKTFLCQSLPNTAYFDCELPRVRQQLEDSETFLNNHRGMRIIFDEIHRLGNPSEILKIAADHFPDIKIIATGSSSLGASSKFGDTLTGRKTEITLTPVLNIELKRFGNFDLNHRYLFGGLPPFLLSNQLPEKDFQEWIDSYWAKDIQELFRLEKKYSFQKFTELLFSQSGNIFEATRFARSCEISRGTISNYLSVLEATFVVNVIRPFNTHKSSEIVAAPKVYGFDTGFICHSKGWTELHREDLGMLWEHYVLNELQGQLQTRSIQYWRDKQNHEIDFIFLKNRKKTPIVIECKISTNNITDNNIELFRRHYPGNENFIVVPDISSSYQKKQRGIMLTYVGLEELVHELKK